MKIIDVNITYSGENIQAKSSDCNLGRQYDNNMTTLIFHRPEDFIDWDLLLYFTNFTPINIGDGNTYQIVNTLTQNKQINLQIAFQKEDIQIGHSNIIYYQLGTSLVEGQSSPEPWPIPVGPPGPNLISSDTKVEGIPDGEILAVLDGHIVGTNFEFIIEEI